MAIRGVRRVIGYIDERCGLFLAFDAGRRLTTSEQRDEGVAARIWLDRDKSTLRRVFPRPIAGAIPIAMIFEECPGRLEDRMGRHDEDAFVAIVAQFLRVVFHVD